MTTSEELIAITQSEYEHLKQCKEELIALKNAEIQNCYNEIQMQTISSIVSANFNLK